MSVVKGFPASWLVMRYIRSQREYLVLQDHSVAVILKVVKKFIRRFGINVKALVKAHQCAVPCQLRREPSRIGGSVYNDHSRSQEVKWTSSRKCIFFLYLICFTTEEHIFSNTTAILMDESINEGDDNVLDCLVIAKGRV